MKLTFAGSAGDMAIASSDTPGGTRRTVIIAGGANLIVALIKIVAGVLTGSSAMLAEAAHSIADTLDQGFLLASIHQGNRQADEDHPFGYGQERYFWSLLAAFGIFIAGAGFSVFEGVLALSRQGRASDALIAFGVLAVAGVAEGISLARALGQVRAEARASRESVAEHLRTSPDTTVKTAVFEDTAAVIGLVLAAAGLALRQLTGSGVWDGAASIAIGVLLVVIAVRLGMDSRDLLIGRSADPKVRAVISGEIRQTPGIDDLIELRTMHLGPDQLIVAARVALDADISADDVENLADQIDARLADRLSQAAHVFIDPTQAAADRS
jgi:cation diffusion facilitator family transporter